MPEEITPYIPPAQSAGPIDNLEAKREREKLINRAFTLEQQRALGMILERWWSQKMAGIETQLVAEAVVEHPKRIAALEAEVEALKARVLHYLP
jgi:hypothetical protein